MSYSMLRLRSNEQCTIAKYIQDDLQIAEIEGNLILSATLISLIDLKVIGKLTASLELASLIRVVTLNNISLAILEITKADKDDIT